MSANICCIGRAQQVHAAIKCLDDVTDVRVRPPTLEIMVRGKAKPDKVLKATKEVLPNAVLIEAKNRTKYVSHQVQEGEDLLVPAETKYVSQQVQKGEDLLVPSEEKGDCSSTNWKEDGNLGKNEDVRWESGSSHQEKGQAESLKFEYQKPGSNSFVEDRLHCNDEIEFASEDFDAVSKSSTIDMKPIKQRDGAGNEEFPIRSDIQTLGFISWDQEFRPNKMLLLCNLIPLKQEAHILFFHAKAMASLFGIGVAFSKVSITFLEQSGYEIHIEDMTEESWKSHWVSSCESVWKPILCKKKNMASMVTTKNVLCLPRDEAFSKFGICGDGIENQTFVSLGTSTSESLKDASNFQPRWIRWFAELVQHIQPAQRCNGTRLNHDNDLQALEMGLWHKSYLAYGTVVEDYLPTATQHFGTDYIKIPGLANLTCNQRGSGSSEGTGGRKNVHESNDGCERHGSKKKMRFSDGDNSTDGKVASGTGVKAIARECKKSLKVNVHFLHRDCDLYRHDSDICATGPTAVTSDMPQSFIKPVLAIEFLYGSRQRGGANQMKTTLGSEYQFDNHDCEDGWYQDKFKLSFRHIKNGLSQAGHVSDIRFHGIVSDVKYEEWESTALSGSENCDLNDNNTTGNLPCISGTWRNETTIKDCNSKQLVKKVKPRCLANNPSIGIEPACKPGILEYRAHSVQEPVMPDSPLWSPMQTTGLYSNVEMTVTGNWLLLGDEKESYEFSAEKVLSKLVSSRGADATTNGSAGARGDAFAAGNNRIAGGASAGRGDGEAGHSFWRRVTRRFGTQGGGNALGGAEPDQLDKARHPFLQIFTRKFVLNHKFSEFFENLEQPDPYEWILVDSSNNNNPVRQAIEGFVPAPGSYGSQANQASAPADGSSRITVPPAPAPIGGLALADPAPTAALVGSSSPTNQILGPANRSL